MWTRRQRRRRSPAQRRAGRSPALPVKGSQTDEKEPDKSCVRVVAAREVLDRGFGKPIRSINPDRRVDTRSGAEPDEKALEGPLKDIAQFLAVLDENLSDKEWVAGELSLADFAVASTFVYRKGSNISLEHVPHVSTWIDRLEARSSWKAPVRPMLELQNN
jgi:glutathione S-transferase